MASEKTPDKQGYSFRQKIEAIQNDLDDKRKVSFKEDQERSFDERGDERPEIGIANQENNTSLAS